MTASASRRAAAHYERQRAAHVVALLAEPIATTRADIGAQIDGHHIAARLLSRALDSEERQRAELDADGWPVMDWSAER